MPLVNLTTDLKSLKYGQDKPGGNSSGQPFITTDIDGAHGTNFTVPGRNLLKLIGFIKEKIVKWFGLLLMTL